MKKLPTVRNLILLVAIFAVGAVPTFAETLPAQYEVARGSALEIKIPRENSTYIEGNFDGQPIMFQKNQDNFTGFLGINRLSTYKTKNLDISLFTPGKGSEKISIPVKVQNRFFSTKYFSLPKAIRKLFGKDYQTPTWNLIYGAMASPATEQLWTDKFMLPTSGKITLGFGDKLFINKKYSGSHFGIDYANVKGTPVIATNTGIVKLAQMTPAYGNVVLIDHGLNIFSMYLHLDSISVNPGDNVTRGQEIAKMGRTGLSAGTHLHFTMFVDKTIVDPDQWLNNF